MIHKKEGQDTETSLVRTQKPQVGQNNNLSKMHQDDDAQSRSGH